MKKLIVLFALIGISISMLALSGCGDETKNPLEKEQPSVSQPENKSADQAPASGPYWLIEVSDAKSFSYAIPNGSGGAIDMTATLHFTAWKEGGEQVFGQYKGRALVALDMDLSNVGSSGVTYTGGVMDDSISDDISFEILPAQQETVAAKGEDIDLAPLAKWVGQAKIITDEYTISQQNWKALADGQVKLNVDGGFGDGTRLPQGFELKAGENSVMVSVGDLTAAYGLEAFSGTITKSDTPPDALSWFRDKVTSRMEERLSLSEESGGQQMPESPSGDEAQNGQDVLTVDSEGREGMDINGDGKLEIYFGEDGKTWADFDGDGKYDVVGEEGADH